MRLTKTQKSLLSKLDNRDRLVHMVCMYDRLDSDRSIKRSRYFNPNALALYLEAGDRVAEWVGRGWPWLDAIGMAYCGDLEAFLSRNWRLVSGETYND